MYRTHSPRVSRTAPTVLVLALAAVWLGFASGCQSSQSPPAFSSVDSWYRPLPAAGEAQAASAAAPGPFRPVDPSLVMLVSESQQAGVEKLLEEKPAIRLTAEEANDLAGWIGAPSHDLYLVRGLDLPRAEGEFRVSQSPAGDVVVAFAATAPAKDPSRMRRQPLVVHLERLPRHVYVTIETPEE